MLSVLHASPAAHKLTMSVTRSESEAWSTHRSYCDSVFCFAGDELNEPTCADIIIQ